MDPLVFIFITILILAPISWIRHIERFSGGFIFAVLVILTMVLTMIVFESIKIADDDNEAGPDWQMFNKDKYYIMISLSFYMFEGIGSMLPIMESSDCKDDFSYLLAAALSTLCGVHIIFSELSYYTYGDDLNEPIIIFKLPAENAWVIIAKILFCIQIIISYPLVIYVTNNIIEQLIFSKMNYSELRKWLKNLSRTIIVTSAVFIGYYFYKHLHKILGFTGIVLGAYIVLVTPSFIHNKLVAKTPCARCFNYFIIIYAILMGLVFGSLIIINWNEPETAKK